MLLSVKNSYPLNVSYFTYKTERYTCRHCGWQGEGSELVQGDVFSELFELDCPACHERVAAVMYPTLAESRDNWQKLSDGEKAHVEAMERSRDAFEAICLKRPEQLPDIPAKEFSLTWDHVDGMTMIRLGDLVIFTEPAVYEGYRRFEEVAQVLKEKYGAALLDLEPTKDSWLYLYGDSISSPERVAKFRQHFFGLKD